MTISRREFIEAVADIRDLLERLDRTSDPYEREDLEAQLSYHLDRTGLSLVDVDGPDDEPPEPTPFLKAIEQPDWSWQPGKRRL